MGHDSGDPVIYMFMITAHIQGVALGMACVTFNAWYLIKPFMHNMQCIYYTENPLVVLEHM